VKSSRFGRVVSGSSTMNRCKVAMISSAASGRNFCRSGTMRRSSSSHPGQCCSPPFNRASGRILQELDIVGGEGEAGPPA
jgi:hypothetical protein